MMPVLFMPQKNVLIRERNTNIKHMDKLADNPVCENLEL